ncbi:MAG TPA: COX15/CtaA family protein [Hyphomicrobiaceae bacterium]|nr:COX15/CtaA family protein [Hyphomicrobiaceae bacterium]
MVASHAEGRDAGNVRAIRQPRAMRAWLLAVAALVFAMIVVGGATRLTGSGLSITEWQPIMGAIPPLSEADWQEAFTKYKQIPQYEQINKGMTLGAFKTIYWWEWAHRFLGRFIGVVFLLPFLYFLATRQVTRALVGRLAGIFVLGGVQGAAGWYMVSSGLADRVSVSQYRLALHLSLAMLIFGALLWVAMTLDRRRPKAGPWSTTQKRAAFILGAVFLQVILGALVAGMKAGLAYNTWPLMDGQLVPSGLFVMHPWYANFFENAMTVQFDHRLMAYVVLGALLWHLWRVQGDSASRTARTSAGVLAAAVLAQVALGIWTLLAQVPLALGLVHQAGAAIVFGLAVWHLYAVRRA